MEVCYIQAAPFSNQICNLKEWNQVCLTWPIFYKSIVTQINILNNSLLKQLFIDFSFKDKVSYLVMSQVIHLFSLLEFIYYSKIS